MKEYNLSNEKRRALAQHHREFQAAIAIIANRFLSVEVRNPEGITKAEGGVKVNGLDITINADNVTSEFNHARAIDTEAAVVDAIQCVESLFDALGEAGLHPYQRAAQKIKEPPLQAALLNF